MTDGTRAIVRPGGLNPGVTPRRLARGATAVRRRNPRKRTAPKRRNREERRRYAARHDEREAIALIRESNRNIYEQRRLGLPQLRTRASRATRGVRALVRR